MTIISLFLLVLLSLIKFKTARLIEFSRQVCVSSSYFDIDIDIKYEPIKIEKVNNRHLHHCKEGFINKTKKIFLLMKSFGIAIEDITRIFFFRRILIDNRLSLKIHQDLTNIIWKKNKTLKERGKAKLKLL